MTVIELMEEIAHSICDKYCKYPEMYGSEDNDIAMAQMIEDKCKGCPLNKIGIE